MLYIILLNLGNVIAPLFGKKGRKVRINRGHILVVMVILILVAASVLRFFTAAPVGIIAIVVFVIVRKMRKKMEEEARRQQEESRTEDTYQETWKAEDAYRQNETDKKGN